MINVRQILGYKSDCVDINLLIKGAVLARECPMCGEYAFCEVPVFSNVVNLQGPTKIFTRDGRAIEYPQFLKCYRCMRDRKEMGRAEVTECEYRFWNRGTFTYIERQDPQSTNPELPF